MEWINGSYQGRTQSPSASGIASLISSLASSPSTLCRRLSISVTAHSRTCPRWAHWLWDTSGGAWRGPPDGWYILAQRVEEHHQWFGFYGGHAVYCPHSKRSWRRDPMPIHTGFADVNGTRLYYELAGAGHPLVLIHGFTLDIRMWDDQFEVFAQGYQVLRYDLRGFGKSAVPTDAPYSHPADLHALLTHLGIDHAYLIGLSMGGGIAIDFAVMDPNMTAALIPVDAALLGGYAWTKDAHWDRLC